jgi:hypothetical protein
MVWNFDKNGNPSLVPAPLHHAATNISISRSTSVEQSLHNNDNSSLSITTDKNKLLSKKMQLLNSKPKNPAYFHQIGSVINGTTNKSFSPRGENCPEKSPNAKCQTHNY